MNIVILGGSGGIGLALVKEVARRKSDSQIAASYFSQQPELALSNVDWSQVDATDESSMEHFASQIDSADWLINAVGMLHTQTSGPEKSVQTIESDFFLHSMQVNALPTLLFAKHFSPKLKKSESPRIVTVSARVGSIGDNRLGGWYSYRASKAALNMIIKTLSIEFARTLPKSAVVALHPGTTDTNLSKPFQRNVPSGKLFSPDRVATDFLNIIEQLTPEHSGRFFAYDFSELPW